MKSIEQDSRPRNVTPVENNRTAPGIIRAQNDGLANFAVYGLARELFNSFWTDSEILTNDYRGRELVRQQIRSLDSICANIEEGFGRGYGKEYPHYLKIARGEARESLGRFERLGRLLPEGLVQTRVATLSQIIGGLTRSITTLENKRKRE